MTGSTPLACLEGSSRLTPKQQHTKAKTVFFLFFLTHFHSLKSPRRQHPDWKDSMSFLICPHQIKKYTCIFNCVSKTRYTDQDLKISNTPECMLDSEAGEVRPFGPFLQSEGAGTLGREERAPSGQRLWGRGPGQGQGCRAVP